MSKQKEFIMILTNSKTDFKIFKYRHELQPVKNQNYSMPTIGNAKKSTRESQIVLPFIDAKKEET
jgi:hypothetical protein